ncbi:MAG: hypothetical protein WA667_07330 [Candidatus Nitrosopolaris sp.]
MSFKLSRTDEQSKNNYLNYEAGQYAIVDLGTTEDPEGPIRSFTLASSTENGITRGGTELVVGCWPHGLIACGQIML